MKTLKYIIFITLAFALASCNDIKIDFLDIDTSSVKQIPAEGGSTTVFASASVCPNVKCSDNWLKYKITQIDEEKYEVVLSAEATKQTIVRYSTVTLNLSDITHRVEISQEAKQKNVTNEDNKDDDDNHQEIDPSKFRSKAHLAALAIADHDGYLVTDYDDDGKTMKLFFEHTTDNPVVAGFEYEYPNGFDSLSLSYYDDGLTKTELIEGRLLKISFKDKSTAIYDYDEMAGKQPYLRLVSENQYDILTSGTTINIEYETNIPHSIVSVNCSQSWITIHHQEGRITMTVEENNDQKDRTAIINLNAIKYGLYNRITVVQMGYTPEGMVVFNDFNFKKAVLNDYDYNNDGQISIEEAESIEKLDVSGLPIRSLKGIEPMRNLRYLNIKDTGISSPTKENIEKEDIINLADPHPYLIDIVCDGLPAMDLSGCATVVWLNNYECSPRYLVAEKCQDIINWTNKNNPIYIEPTERVSIPTKSTDFSRRGEHIYLHKHTKGDGIEIVFTINYCLDTDIESELDDRIAKSVCDALLALEPMATYKEYFDIIHLVNVWSYRSDEYYPDVDVYSNSSLWFNEMDLMNSVNDMFFMPGNNRSNNMSMSRYLATDVSTVNHEIIGHNYIQLKDEYHYDESTKKWKNTILCENIDELPWYWKKLMEIPEYKDRVKLYKKERYGISYYASTENSIMHNSENFSALQRFLFIINFLRDSKLYKEILPNIPKDFTIEKYDSLYDDLENQEAVIKYFIEYDKINI